MLVKLSQLNRPLIYCMVLLYSMHLMADQKVDLQLRWEPSFQFAGFYTAQSENYYQQQAISVSIYSGFNDQGELISPIDEVMTGRADFGVDDLQLLNTIDQGGQLVILAPIMQKSPSALITHADNQINKVHDLIGQTIKVPDNNHLLNELKVLLNAHKIDLSQIKIINGPIRMRDLNDPEIDVLLSYGANAKFYAEINGMAISVKHLSDLGSIFYGNVLFTHQSVIDQQPQLVEQFLQASLQGWQDAMKHEKKSIEMLSGMHNFLVPAADQYRYNQLYFESMKNYMQWPEVPIGQSSRVRWQQIYNDLYNYGLIKGGWNINDYLYSPHLSIRQWSLYAIIFLSIVVMAFVVISFKTLQEYRHVFLIGLTIIFLLYVLIEYNIKQGHKQSLRYQALHIAQNLNSTLTNYLNNDVILVKNLAAYIAINPDVTKHEFLAFCREIFNQGEGLINIAAAPDLVIKMVCPVVGNEVTLGVDYRQLPSQKDLVFEALQKRTTVFSNPVQLIQGGRGVFIRQGVYETGTKEPWGVVSAAVDIDKIFEQSGVYSQTARFNLVILSSPLAGQSQIIYGNPYYIQHAEALSVPMNIIDNQWLIYISPINGWSMSPVRLWLLRFFGILLVLVWFFRVRFLLKRKHVRTLIQQEVKTHETLLHEVGTVAKIAAWRINEQGDILQWTAKGNDILGQYVPHKIAHVDDFWDLFSHDMTESFKNDIMQAGLSGDGFDVEVPYIDDTGQKRWLRVVSDQTIETLNGKEIIGAIQDITDYKEINELIQYQATHDILTDLYNRTAFIHQTGNLLQQAKMNNSMAALIFIDLDNFKNINDSLGHGYGDKVLARFSSILKELSEQNDILGRYSGDEFVMLTCDTAYGILKQKVDILLQHFGQPMTIDGQSIFISASIGVAVYPDHADNSSDLLVYADLAMYQAKKRGKNNVCFFNTTMQQHAQQQLSLKNALQINLETQSIEVFYQPIISTDNNQVTKMEALMRCPDSNGGYLNTEKLIQIFEETSTLFEIDIAVLKRVNEDIDFIMQETGVASLGVSLNVSPNMFTCQTQLLNEWLFWLYELADKIKVTLEITERALLDKNTQTLSLFKDFQQRGIAIAIDDFGVGYSSLISLVDFPVSVIKIDRSLVEKLTQDEGHYNQLISSIVDLSVKLGLEVIAEGVEKTYQAKQLSHYGCHKLQGYYFSKAINKLNVIEFIKKSRK